MTFGENTSEGYNDLIDAQLPWAELTPDRNLPSTRRSTPTT